MGLSGIDREGSIFTPPKEEHNIDCLLVSGLHPASDGLNFHLTRRKQDVLRNYRRKKKLDKMSRERLTDATMYCTHWEHLIKCNGRHNQLFVEGDKKEQSSHREAVTIRAVTWRLYKSHFLHSQRLLCRQSQTATTIMPHLPPASPGDSC